MIAHDRLQATIAEMTLFIAVALGAGDGRQRPDFRDTLEFSFYGLGNRGGPLRAVSSG
jgi:hypothetical protein